MPSYMDPKADDFDRDWHISNCIACQQLENDMGEHWDRLAMPHMTCYQYQWRATNAAKRLVMLFKHQPDRKDINEGIPRNLDLMIDSILANVERGSILYHGE